MLDITKFAFRPGVVVTETMPTPDRTKFAIRPGTAVMIGDIPATVLAVVFEGPNGETVSYRVAWWDGRTRKAEWVGEPEVRLADESDAGRLMGFHLNGAR